MSVNLGGLPPPPNTKKLAALYTAHPYRSDYPFPPFFFVVVACMLAVVSLFRRKIRRSLIEDIFFLAGGGGGGGRACRLKILVPPTKTQGPPPPSAPLLKKILATPLQVKYCTMITNKTRKEGVHQKCSADIDRDQSWRATLYLFISNTASF